VELLVEHGTDAAVRSNDGDRVPQLASETVPAMLAGLLERFAKLAAQDEDG
jgi:hypothetical protein